MSDQNQIPDDVKNSSQKKEKVKKNQGPIRWEAILPFTLFIVGIFCYFHFLFDHNFKSALEFAGYHAVGAEVNVDKVETSFLDAALHIHRVQVTNPDFPQNNMIEIGDLRFAMLWDALLRGKIVINEATIEQIAFDTKRSFVGKVKPPEPVSNEPSLLEKEGEKLAKEGLEKAKQKYNDNVLGDVAALLSGSDGSEQMDELKSQIKSKQRLEELQKEYKIKEGIWNSKFAALPDSKKVNSIAERFAKVKTKNFKSPQELQDSIKKIESLVKEADGYVKQIQATSNDLNKELKTVDSELKALEKMIQQDIKMLESHFKLPNIDATAITKSLLARYTDPYLSKINKYHDLANQYLPPNLIEKDKDQDEDEIQFQPRPRAIGMSYEFGKQNGYPFFWVKKSLISSKANPNNPMIGDLTGQITNITSNQPVIGFPTVFSLKGGFPGLDIHGLSVIFTMDHVRNPHKETFEAKLGSYPLGEKVFVNSSDVSVGLSKATGSFSLNVNYSKSVLNFDLNNEYNKIDYAIDAKNSELKTILTNVFASIPMINIVATGSGKFPDIPIEIKSNLGPEISNALAAQIRQKIEEVKLKVKKTIDETVAKEKEKLESEIKKIKSQVDNEVKKLQAQADSEKKKIEAKVKETQKQAEKELKDKLGKDGKKKLEDLKKQLGL